jgi:dnd system-associated protein 4
MSANITIADAAETALKSLGKPSTAEEIHCEILRQQGYKFNTPDSVHVVETELKRYSEESSRADKRDTPRFRINSDKTFTMATPEAPSSRRSQSVGMKRILRSSDKEDLIEELMSARIGIFREIWRLLLFSAQIGLKAKRREALRSVETGKGIDQATFGNSASWPGILYLMSLSETGDSGILASSPEGEDQRVQLFQEYANGGLTILKDFFSTRTLDLDGFLSFIEIHHAQPIELSAPDIDLAI